VASKVLPL